MHVFGVCRVGWVGGWGEFWYLYVSDVVFNIVQLCFSWKLETKPTLYLSCFPWNACPIANFSPPEAKKCNYPVQDVSCAARSYIPF